MPLLWMPKPTEDEPVRPTLNGVVKAIFWFLAGLAIGLIVSGGSKVMEVTKS